MTIAVLGAALASAQNPPQQVAHFHHVQLNVTDPAAAVAFYTSKFDCEKAIFLGMDAVWAQESWLLFTKVATPPRAEVTSAIWHIGWGAEDVPATYRRQLDAGTNFETPLTDISDLVGAREPGVFFYAYVDGADHQLIELNTANHHRFGHIHMLSKDPIAAGEWYMKEFGIPRAGRGTPSREPRMYKGFQVGPSASLQMDNVNIIIFPMEYAKTQWPELWKNRNDFESTRGHTVDHIAFGVDNLDETVARLKKDGVNITHGSLDGSNAHDVFIEGPDHVSIELVEGQPHKE
ncbi:MAG TPA: VOC family protein [Bryobacteraceae bacterium]|nr:VOC family protein [Bryobacteraceae bacterium]